jgi:hypothetical protein
VASSLWFPGRCSLGLLNFDHAGARRQGEKLGRGEPAARTRPPVDATPVTGHRSPVTLMKTLFDQETAAALTQLCDETCEALQLSKASPDLDDLSATFAVALLKLGLATGFVEQRHPGFAKEVEEKRQRVIAALVKEQQEQQKKH